MAEKRFYTQEQMQWLREVADAQGVYFEGGPGERQDQLLKLADQGVLKLYDQD